MGEEERGLTMELKLKQHSGKALFTHWYLHCGLMLLRIQPM